MKKIFLFLSIIISFSASAQVYQHIGTWYQYDRFKVTKALGIPYMAPPSLDTTGVVPMYFDATDTSMKVYYGGSWLKMGGNTIIIIDSAGGDSTVIPGGGSNAVASVFDRVGHVVKQAGDYNFADLGLKPTTIQDYGITNGVRTDQTYSNPTFITGLHVNKLLGLSGTQDNTTVLYGDWVFRNPTSVGSPSLVAISDGQNSTAAGSGTTVSPYRINVKHFADSVYKKAGTDSIFMRHSGADRYMWKDGADTASGGTGSITIPGTDGDVMFNDGDTLQADTTFKYNKTQHKLSVDSINTKHQSVTKLDLNGGLGFGAFTLDVNGTAVFKKIQVDPDGYTATAANTIELPGIGSQIDVNGGAGSNNATVTLFRAFPYVNGSGGTKFVNSLLIPGYANSSYIHTKGYHDGALYEIFPGVFIPDPNPIHSWQDTSAFSLNAHNPTGYPARSTFLRTTNKIGLFLWNDSSAAVNIGFGADHMATPTFVFDPTFLKVASAALPSSAAAGVYLVSWDPTSEKFNKTDTVPQYTDNAAALVGGLTAGMVYRNGDDLKIVH